MKVQSHHNVFSSLDECTAFKRALNKHTILDTPFVDLNAHLVDSFSVNQHRNVKGLQYAFSKFGWVFSKLFKKKLRTTGAAILLVPIEPHKDRSMGLYTPIMACMQPSQYQLAGLPQMFDAINPGVFFRWLYILPTIFRHVKKALNSSEAALLAPIKSRLIIDTAIHYLWLLQLRSFFKQASFKALLVDWDRHTLQSLIVQAANKENVTTYTFVHGAIYTPEKFVPLIASKCLAWGNSHINFFTHQGEPVNKMIKVGNTRFKKELPSANAVFQKFGIDNSKKIILHPSQNFPDLEDHVIVKEIHQHISANNHFILAVKVHPSQNNSKLIKEISGLQNLIILDASISAAEALSIASFTIIVSSTFSIDAMIAGVPVAIYTQPSAALRGIAVDLVQKANVPFLQTAKDFSTLLMGVEEKTAKTYFDMQAQQSFISDYCAYYDIDSAKRITAFLLNEKTNH